MFVRQDEKTHHVINSLQSFIIRNQNKFVENIDNSRQLHGLRHLYAQTRYKAFIVDGFNERQAKLKVAHELGHFRAEITEVYLN